MSTTRPLKVNRNLAVLLARGLAEAQPGKIHVATVSHAPGCPGMTYQSMLLCRCRPEVVITEVASGDNS